MTLQLAPLPGSKRPRVTGGWEDTCTLGSSSPPVYSVTSSGLSSTQFPHVGEEGSGPICRLAPSLLRSHSSSFFCPPQAASGPRVIHVPQIILTECTPSFSSPPETSLEELGPRTVPTPRPRTLAGGGRAWNGSRTLLGLEAEVPWPRSGPVFRKESAILQSPHKAEAGVLRPQGPCPDKTQKPLTSESHSEETSQNSECDMQACRRGQRLAVSPGRTVQDATLPRMDSLEETLQELEAALMEMGANPATRGPGSPQPLPPRPQVAAFPHHLPCSLPAPISGLTEWREWGRRSSAHRPQPHCLCFSLPCSGSPFPGQGLWAEPGAAGKPAHPGLSSAWA